MTIDQFNNATFGNRDRAIYDGETYQIRSVDFKEALVGLLMEISGGDPDEITWVRCENITHIPPINL